MVPATQDLGFSLSSSSLLTMSIDVLRGRSRTALQGSGLLLDGKEPLVQVLGRFFGFRFVFFDKKERNIIVNWGLGPHDFKLINAQFVSI